MAITAPDISTLLAEATAFFRTSFPGRALGKQSFLGKVARALAMALLGLQKSVEAVSRDAVPSDATSTAGLEDWAYAVGVPSSGGGFGRNPAVAASGGAGSCTGVCGTVFADGLLAIADDGTTQVKLSGTVTIPGAPPDSGSVAGQFVAVTAGVAGNLDAGTVLTWQSPPAGADATVTLSSPLTGGLDEETDVELLARIRARFQDPPKGGAASDYRAWAEAADPSIERAHVYPNAGGAGSVHVVITSGGSGTARKPSTTVIAAVQAAIDAVRPAGVNEATVEAPATGTGLTIHMQVLPSASRFAFDWDDTAEGVYVDAYTPGSPAKIQCNAPPSLLAAIDQGLKPRLQVFSAGAPAIPIQVRCTGHESPGGDPVVVLEDPLPTGWVAPAPGVEIFAGGPVVTPIATATLAYVDSLGPSRAGGYADENDPWEDTCTIARLIDVAMETCDTDGKTRLLKNVYAGFTTINGFASDKQGAADLGGAPELLYATAIQVTQ